MHKRRSNKSFIRRATAMAVMVILVFSVFVFRLVQFQLLEGESFYTQAAQTVTYTFPITAARGEIVDRYGRPLATNTTGYALELNKLFLPNSKLNDTLLAVVHVLEQSGEAWNDTTPLTKTAPYDFTNKNADGTDGNAAKAMKKAFGKQEYATAKQVIEAAIKTFDLENYTPSEQRLLLGIRYEMLLRDYSASVPFLLAEEVSDKTISIIKENNTTMPGVDVKEVTVREYPDGKLMPHILGRIGLISEEEWTENDFALQAAGYKKDDYIGKFGIEQAMEPYLRGEDGLMEVVRKQDGTFISSRVIKEPQPGNSIFLTIDKELQAAVQQQLESFITSLRSNKDPKRGGAAEGGSVVVLDSQTGGILVSANYPTYDINDYFSNYSELAEAPYNPLYNRSFMGLYRPGSSFKPVVALSGLLSGEITGESTIYCSGTYGFYAPSYTPGCLGVHGNTSVRTSLQKSCNIFYYDLGRRLGQDAYNETAEALGLGVPTGVEITENVGRLSNVETSKALGQEWSPADSSQAAIGQLNTAVTPLQMATMGATLANDGTRLESHLVQTISDFNTGAAIESFGATVVNELPDKNNAYKIVKEGMVLAASDGSSGTYLGASSPYVVAAKTGSPQENDPLITNATMVAYAPAEKPAYAASIVVEKGVNGYRCAELMRQVFDACFAVENVTKQPVQENQLVA